jgi:FkbM family methyltransferase
MPMGWTVRALPRLLDAIKDVRPDVVHLEYPTRPYQRRLWVAALPLMLRALGRHAVVVTAHEFHDAPRRGKVLIWLATAPANRTIVNNEASLKALRPLIPNAVEMIPIGSSIPFVDHSTAERDQLLARFGLNPGGYALFFGSLDPGKGMERLLSSYTNWPTGLKLVIVGTPTDSGHVWRRRQQAKDGAMPIVWTGFLEPRAVSVLCQSSLLGVLPFAQPASLRRSSLVALLNNGVPTITTGPVGGPLGGCVVEVERGNDAEQLTFAVTRVWADEALRTQLRDSSLALMSGSSWPAISRAHAEIYENVVTVRRQLSGADRRTARADVVRRAKRALHRSAINLGLSPVVDAYFRLRDPLAGRDQQDMRNMSLLLRFWLRADSNCVDIGANEGKVLRQFLDVAPLGHHMAFEPLPELARHLRETYPVAEVRELALANQRGMADFVRVVDDPGYSGLRRQDYRRAVETETIKVQVDRLDDCLPDEYQPALIKIDVEGAELDVLKGAMDTITRWRPLIIFEHHKMGASGYGAGPAWIYPFFRSTGYEIMDIDGEGPYGLDAMQDKFDRASIWTWVARPLPTGKRRLSDQMTIPAR